jgi:hypothetical protein
MCAEHWRPRCTPTEYRGNCGASGAPTVLSENWDNPQVGDAVALAVVGSGLTWAGALLGALPHVEPRCQETPEPLPLAADYCWSVNV